MEFKNLHGEGCQACGDPASLETGTGQLVTVAHAPKSAEHSTAPRRLDEENTEKQETWTISFGGNKISEVKI